MKTTYEKFLDANNKLMKCFESVPQDKWKKMSADEQSSLCSSEREAVKSYFTSNSVGFRNLINERMEIIKQQQA